MRNKLIAFSLPFVFAVKAFAAPVGSACDWVDQEALVELGLANSVSKESPVGLGVSCAFAAPDVPIPSLIVTVQPVSGDFVFKPVCNWGPPQFSSVELGICYMNVGNTSVGFTLMVTTPSTSTIQATLSAQVERLFNKHVETAPK